jgi:hypothetical protein
MVSVFNLSEADGKSFVAQLRLAEPLIGVCLSSNIKKIINVYLTETSSINDTNKYIKFHHYALVSSIVDTLGVLAASDFSVDKDEQFRQFLDNVKANFSLSSFNDIWRSFPYEDMHGQDILLFQAIEREGLNGGISFFRYREIRMAIAEMFIEIYKSDPDEPEFNLAKDRLVQYYGDFFSDPSRLAEVDMSFNYLNFTDINPNSRSVIFAFEKFMQSLPANVYHCHEGKTLYSNRGFKLTCDCGQLHMLDECEAVCDFYSQFTVFRSPCGTSISKIVSEGIFRVTGIKIASKLTASKSIIDLAEQAVSSRKRTK